MTSGHFSQERRKHPRLKNNIPLKISSEDGDVVTETWNLSQTGVYCRANRYLEPMTRLKINLLLPIKKNQKVITRKISCEGVVVRTESIPGSDYYNTAIFFNEIQQKDADHISDYINEELERKKEPGQTD